MNENIISSLRSYFAEKPVEKAWLFGSFSRGEETPESDIDILVTFDKQAHVSLLYHVAMSFELKDLLGRDVDLVTEGSLLPFAAANAESDKILIYEIES